MKNNCWLFSPTPYFWVHAMWWCHLNFSPDDPCCHATNFGTKIDYNSAPWKIIACCFHLPPIFGVEQSKGVIQIYPLKTPVAIATIQKLQNFALQPMEISKWYNSVPVKDNRALFAPTPIFRPGLSDGVVKIFPLPTTVAMATNFGTKLTTTQPPWKKIAPCLHLPPTYFWARAIRWCHLNFSLSHLCCHGNKFGDKIDHNSAPAEDNCTLFSPTPYIRARAMQWHHANFSPENPCCHGNQQFLFKNKIGCSTACIKMSQTLLHRT